MNSTITLRPEQPEDQELLRLIYGSARAAEMELLPWNDARKEQFLNVQFRLQSAHFRREFPDASFSLILENGKPVGRLYVERAPEEVRILDIALLPEHRCKGIGSGLLRELTAEAAGRGAPVTLHIEQNNRAVRLFERLGFRAVADRVNYLELEWRELKH